MTLIVNPESGRFIPALSFDWLTKLYDPLLRWTMPERSFKGALVEQSRIEDARRVLDVGCGTATLLLMIKELYPNVEAVGVDGDPKILGIARAKVQKAGADVALHEAMAFELPFPDGHFDRVLSSLVLHHLTSEDKMRALREARRVLRPGGELHVADFGKPQNALMRFLAVAVQCLEQSTDNITGRLPEMFAEAGFGSVEETERRMTVFGTLSLYAGRKTEERNSS